MRDIVVTGFDLITPLGAGRIATWDGLLQQRSGVSLIDRFCTDGLPVRIAAPVRSYEAGYGYPATRSFALARDVARSALRHAGLAPDDPELAVVAATPPCCPDLGDRLAYEDFAAGGGATSLPTAVRERLVAFGNVYVGEAIAAELGLPKPVCLNTACASGVTALSEAADMIEAGAACRGLGIATDGSLDAEWLTHFALLGALSRRNDDPQRASRPFSAGRDGFVFGEAAAALVLEPRQSAQARGARCFANLAGIAETSDGFHLTRADPEAASILRCMTASLENAGLTPADVAHVNAHGTSTIENDRTEGRGLQTLFQGRRVPVTANKSNLGHSLTAAGAVEACISIMTLCEGLIPPTLNYDPDPELELDIVHGSPRALSPGAVLCNAFGFGGQNTSVVFTRDPEAPG